MRWRSAETPDQVYIRASLQTAARCRGLSEMSMHLFEPELDGLAGELRPSLRRLKSKLPESKVLLVLRDILDSRQRTTQTWRERHYYDIVQSYFNGILVMGDPDLFDVRTEYDFPAALRDKVWFCGYLAKNRPCRSRAEVREELQVSSDENLELVTICGGLDDEHVTEDY